MRGVELRVEEREIISRELAGGSSLRWIGSLLGRDHSVISREVTRNGGRGRYRAVPAQDRAVVGRARPKDRVLVVNTRLHDAVRDGLAEK